MFGYLSAGLTALVIAAGPALACSCIGDGKHGCQIPPADVLVLARVVAVEQTSKIRPVRPDNGAPANANRRARDSSAKPVSTWGNVTVTLEVIERFRGEARNPLVIRTESSTTACGFPFQVGKPYLVFAEVTSDYLTVSFCSATQPAKAAAWRIRQLRAMRDRNALPALFGSVLTRPPAAGEDADEYVEPAPNLTVVAQSGGREYRTRTGNDGVYEFHGLSPGEYYLRVEAPASRVAVWSGGVETVRTPAGLEPRCPVDFQLFGNGRLSGTVIDGNGHPVSGIVTVEYVDDRAAQASRFSAVVKDGRFEILRLWPGQYRLEFLRDGPPTTEPVYYPGTRFKSNSVLIELGEETNVDNLQFSVFQLD